MAPVAIGATAPSSSNAISSFRMGWVSRAGSDLPQHAASGVSWSARRQTHSSTSQSYTADAQRREGEYSQGFSDGDTPIHRSARSYNPPNPPHARTAPTNVPAQREHPEPHAPVRPP